MPFRIGESHRTIKTRQNSWTNHPGSKNQILDITEIDPEKMKKVYPPGPFFLCFSPKNELYIQKDPFKTLGTPLYQSWKNNFYTPCPPRNKKMQKV